MKSIRRTFLLLFTTLACISCGWQLRGTEANGTQAAQIDSIYVHYARQSSELRPYLNELLKRRNITQTNDSPLQLYIATEQLSKRSMAMNETGITIQYQLILHVDFGYTYQQAGGNVIKQEQQTLYSRRAYDFDPQQIMAENQEQAALLAEMRKEIARQILARIKMPKGSDE